MNESRLKSFLREAVSGAGGITVLTGAGISAESGIPTFRGPEGYWSVGSQVYQPQQMATFAMFQQNPRAVWQWYLYRLGVCLAAQPNAGHLALVDLARLVPDRFALITQNVDNLHLRAGQRLAHTFQIHGNISYVRCASDCRLHLEPIPPGVTPKTKNEPISDSQWQLLRCPACSGLLRPHVLWFDEAYNEHYFHLHRVLEIARETLLLIVVGTSAQTNLPNQVVHEVYRHGGIIIDVNVADNPFRRLAAGYARGLAVEQPSGTALPRIAQLLGTCQT